ncbi:hypothetical protein F4V57_14635 [Acinetobacter qingfengensis]|uniref:Uncharacterized protein n=1 Tax=Acinetobacter qingfengensis TaxID=1262585 RepID=A0A1E7QZR5_9GAMM|nr:hypothetical protein [Acinetobacter qingfengensis]KAA8730805.1 hypothetical protein F4V57_14620 [Acinetobacter qingfengensis]KAA8730808.1 hypothetical protein F4V57_14635 [Acinetobacter qingfengensis]OEY92534.1 hypothetical protein BJI46_14570 [Acinetobacter qingfengensis]
MTQLPEHPIMTVTGIRKSEGGFTGENGLVNYSNTVVTVLQPFSEQELLQGAIGLKSTEYKIKGAQFFDDYRHLHDRLPAQAQMIFKLDVTRKVPSVQLVAMKFEEPVKAQTKNVSN